MMKHKKGLLLLIIVFILCILSFATYKTRDTIHALWSEPEEKYAIQLVDFNIQYVAGDSRVENAIDHESLEPLCDIFLSRRNWHATLQMSALHLKKLAEDRPYIFRKLKKLVLGGQLEIICAQYSGELTLAYGINFFRESIRQRNRIISALDIPISTIGYLHEDQIGPGLLDEMRIMGFDAFVSLSYSGLLSDHERYPLYEYDGMPILIARKYQDNYQITRWVYFGDGEWLLTGGPSSIKRGGTGEVYDVAHFKKNKRFINKYIRKMDRLERRGFQILSIGEYIKKMQSAYMPPAPATLLIDLVRGEREKEFRIFNWAGKNIFLRKEGGKETDLVSDDVHILSENVRAGHILLAAQTLKSYLSRKGISGDLNTDYLFKLLLEAQVTDATGFVPAVSEQTYALSRSREIINICSTYIQNIKIMLARKERVRRSAMLCIDTKEKRVFWGTRPEIKKEKVPPLAIHIEGDLSHNIQWFSHNEKQWSVIVTFQLKERNPREGQYFRIIFPKSERSMSFCPFGKDKLFRVDLGRLPYESYAVAVPNGLVGLGLDSNSGEELFLIKHNAVNHTAVHFYKNKTHEVSFEMLGSPKNKQYKWRFTLFRGNEDDAIALANRINIYPVLYF